MRISDWSSDVCSSDLLEQPRTCHPITGCGDALGEGRIIFMTPRYACSNAQAAVSNKQEKNWRSRKFCYAAIVRSREHNRQIGRATCRDRVCQYVKISVVVG